MSELTNFLWFFTFLLSLFAHEAVRLGSPWVHVIGFPVASLLVTSVRAYREWREEQAWLARWASDDSDDDFIQPEFGVFVRPSELEDYRANGLRSKYF